MGVQLYCTATSEADTYNPRCGGKLRVASWLGREAFPSEPLPVVFSSSPFLLPYSKIVMATDFKASWRKARAAASTDEAECIQTLAEILSLKEGRKFILALEAKDAKMCIEILHHVRSNPHKLPL